RSCRDRRHLRSFPTRRSSDLLAVVCVGYLALPHINDVGEDFPATLLWEFRMASLATQASLWLVLGLAFAWLTERFDRRFAAQTVGVRCARRSDCCGPGPPRRQ